MSKRVDFIVIEDEESICQEYNEKVKQYDNLFLIATTNNMNTGIDIVKEYKPSVIVLDLELHKGFGNGLAFLNLLFEMKPEKKPYILVVTNNISSITHNMARNFGADFIITKNQFDYSVEMILNTISELINTGRISGDKYDYCEALYKNQAGLDYKQKLRSQISKELDLIGISHKHKGRNYLKDAIELVYEKRTTNISTQIAEKYKKTNASIERAMQTAINYAWKTTDTETLSNYYTTYINPKKGVPTITEFIYYYADKVKKNI